MADRWEVTKMNYSHEALVDLILANPAATNSELGNAFGRTPQWVSLVKNSDMFREVYAARAQEIADPILSSTIEQRLQITTARSLEILNEKLSRPAQDIPDNLVLAAAALGAKGLGVGGFSSRPAPPPELPKADRVERLADRLLNLNRPQEITDVIPIERPQAVPAHPVSAPAAALPDGSAVRQAA